MTGFPVFSCVVDAATHAMPVNSTSETKTDFDRLKIELNMIAEDALTSHKIKAFLKKVELMYPLLKDIVDGFIDFNL